MRHRRRCVDRGLEPLVTLHHFTHPAWLGEDLWTRPDAVDRFRSWAELAVEALAPSVRLWVTINEINVLFAESWLLGSFPPGRYLAHTDAALAASNLLAAHVAAYEVIHGWRSDARHHQQRLLFPLRARPDVVRHPAGQAHGH